MSDLNGAAPAASGSTPPSSSPAPIQVNPVGSTPPPAPSNGGDWTSGFDDDSKGYIQNKGFDSPKKMLESYRNIEKLVGVPKERLLKLPDKEDAPEWNEVWERLGMPKNATDYKLGEDAAPENKAFAEWAQKTFHELKIPRKQAESLAAKFNERSAQAMKAENDNYQVKFQQESEALKKEWGAAHDQNIQVGKRGMAAFGFDGPTIEKFEQVLGYQGVMKFAHMLGSKVGEDGFVGGDSQNKFNGVMTPEAARNRIKELAKDADFSNKLLNKDVSAKAEWDRLHKFASPSEG